ncbi:hypothetical protein Q31b_34410 [Novipirellula aureliae]|uniref:Cytochrome oxidase maturation protein cbb3-type n=2 Tax=Novipirellula aureliae TaxID=2527966 RepID=A0A5C6DVZ2_9BACT|nr:hypothetical protein Q31b_34410 [Novipirellula aureliae]
MSALGISSFVALVWAIQTGKFSNIEGDVMSIFDADEPIGRVRMHFHAIIATNKHGRLRLAAKQVMPRKDKRAEFNV